MIVKKYLASGVPFSSSEVNSILSAVVQLYMTHSRHPLFCLLERGQSHVGNSSGGHLPLLHKVSQSVVDVLRLFILHGHGEPWSRVVLSFVCSRAFELPR